MGALSNSAQRPQTIPIEACCISVRTTGPHPPMLRGLQGYSWHQSRDHAGLEIKLDLFCINGRNHSQVLNYFLGCAWYINKLSIYIKNFFFITSEMNCIGGWQNNVIIGEWHNWSQSKWRVICCYLWIMKNFSVKIYFHYFYKSYVNGMGAVGTDNTKYGLVLWSPGPGYSGM